VKNHPLFCELDDPENPTPEEIEKQGRDIGYIQIYRFNGHKREAIIGQHAPDAIITIEDLVKIAGWGDFELVGRDLKTGQVRLRQRVTIAKPNDPNEAARSQPNGYGQQQQPPNPYAPQQQPMPPAAFAQTPTQPQTGMFAGMPMPQDPMTAMMMMMFTLTNQQMMAQREDSKAFMQMQQSNSQQHGQVLVETFKVLANTMAGRPPEPASSSAGMFEAFQKGVELTTEFAQGVREGQEQAGGNSTPLDYSAITTNILQSLKTVAEIAKVTASGQPAPVIPEGGP
jgi:hypothetical protein